MLIFLATIVVLFLTNPAAAGRSKAFGQRLEYRYEYDPSKETQPVIQWKFDDLVHPEASDSGVIRMNSGDVRKSPRHEYKKPKFEFLPKKYERRNYASQEDFGYADRFENDRSQPTNFGDKISDYLRNESEKIIRQHFPRFPFSFEQENFPRAQYRHFPNRENPFWLSD